ncbi:uncharacterized protein F4812DRAFT_455196 [Daldinia caldariorum]|uniref:uncharacterized protein n=1 Tax=Daldinia caldariorum TaxID=326644 RepID=UPI002007217B|nr:uncharacterized protein F4812DRAFT_455196 [Daldinia caldariorum]KAI1471084.1 hypothetical protein F4812DRAFT_455196 [Daldinia caldariorum]
MTEKQMDQSQARRRRRDGAPGVQQRLYTKEKPYVCHCGSAYSRRDLLTRHQRITHETISPRSSDGLSSEDNHQLSATEEDPTSEDHISSTASIPDLSMDHNIHQHQPAPPYSNPAHGLAIQTQAVTQPYQLIAGQDIYPNGQHYQGFDHFPGIHDFSDPVSLPPEWSPYFHSPVMEQEMVDPALRASIVDVSSPLSNENFSMHGYNSWMSPTAQKWGN